MFPCKAAVQFSKGKLAQQLHKIILKTKMKNKIMINIMDRDPASKI